MAGSSFAVLWGPATAVLFAWTGRRMGGKKCRPCAPAPRPSSQVHCAGGAQLAAVGICSEE